MKAVLTPASLALAVTALAGCTAVGPRYQAPTVPSPSAYKNLPTTSAQVARLPAAAAAEAWWRVFEDPLLDELETVALAQNQQLAAAVARVDEARARLGFSRADARPSASIGATAKLAGESAEHPIPGTNRTYRERGDSYRVPLDASYEIDLWGRVRRSIESARAQVEASEQDQALVRLTLTGDLAQNYLSLRGLDAEFAVLTRAVAIRRDQVDVYTARLKAGLINALDVSRAQVELATAESELADVARRREQTANALAVLTGKAPADFAVLAHPENLAPPPAVPAGLPSDLLKRRPDVREAERLLAARTAEIGVARAAFFPVLRLTGSAGFESADLGALLGRPSQFWQLGPSISYSLFDGGRNRANLEAAEARARGAVADYRQKILGAFRDVEDALVDLRQQAEESDAQNRALTAARDSVELATKRYERGLVNFLEVAEAQRSALSAERSAVQLASARQAAAVRLIKALGGGWDEIRS
jgi:multidrug efflux system outer membrane protein